MTGELEKSQATLNLAIGPSCPVRCEGCYNHFGNTARLGGLISADDVLSFASDAKDLGVTQATLSGGDPLFHPEIVDITIGLKDLAYSVKVDTVGTALIESPRIAYKGTGIVSQVDPLELAPHVDFMSIPLDGASQSTVGEFRRGRKELFAETLLIGQILERAGISFGVNTVLNRRNQAELVEMRDIISNLGAVEWQIFEYDPGGPNPSNAKADLRFAPGEFNVATAPLENASTSDLRIVIKNLTKRSGAYFLVDDSGLAWQPAGVGIRQIFGHIVSDRHQVLSALAKHISQKNQK